MDALQCVTYQRLMCFSVCGSWHNTAMLPCHQIFFYIFTHYCHKYFRIFLQLCLLGSMLAEPSLEEVHKWCLQCEALCLGLDFLPLQFWSHECLPSLAAPRPAAPAASDQPPFLHLIFSHAFFLKPSNNVFASQLIPQMCLPASAAHLSSRRTAVSQGSGSWWNPRRFQQLFFFRLLQSRFLSTPPPPPPPRLSPPVQNLKN